MENIFQDVSILVPHSVEILQCEPLRFEDLFGRRETESAQHTVHELIVGHTVLRAAADVVCLVPEAFRHPVFTHLGQQPAGVFYRGPFQNSSHRDMEGSRIQYAEDTWIKDTALAQ